MSSNQINYKQKYQELKMKYMEAVDQAFRLGFEAGAQQAQQDQMMQQQQQQAELEAAMAGQVPGQANGDPNQDPTVQGQPDQTAPGQDPAGSELDQHIAKLESMMSSGSAKPEAAAEIQKSLDAIKALRASQVKHYKVQAEQAELKKSAAAIPGIVKALHKPSFKIGQNANHNMTTNAKQAVGMQHKIVSDIMEKWESEEQKAAKEIKQTLSIEGLTKKE